MPKRMVWQPIVKNRLKDTFFASLDLTKDDDPATAIDYGLLSEMFCRPEAEVKAEEEKKKAAKER